MSWREALRSRQDEIGEKRLTVGFDGFIDTIVRPLKQAAGQDRDAQCFTTIREFGEFLAEKAEKSCSIELHTEARQLGGNLPFLSRAAGGLGLDVSCIGMLGTLQSVDPLFAAIPCKLYAFAPPGQSTCLEFDDGKVLMSEGCVLPSDAWQLVLQATDGKAPALFQEADLLALVNWSELSFAQDLWQHVLDEVSKKPADRARFAFFDLCDVSRRTEAELEQVLRLIGCFSGYRTSILSLNENEALTAGQYLLNKVSDLEKIAHQLHAIYGIDEVLIHTIRESILLTPRGTTRQSTNFVQKPRISTGAGDNFNAASCFAAVMGLSDEDRIAFANAFAHQYISLGYNVSLDALYQIEHEHNFTNLS